MSYDYGFDMFNILEVLFPIMFLLILGIIIFIIVKGLSTWSHNNKQPIIPVRAAVVTKRENVSLHHSHDNDHMHVHSSTSYYVTFQFENRERMELHVSAGEYGKMVEGDTGILSFQGSRFIRFERDTML